MPNLNKVMLIGNLTHDPELKHTPKGTAVAELGLAINRVWKDENNQKQEETTFVDVTLWGRQAEIAKQYLTKGNPVYIEGRLSLDTWDDKASGQKRTKLKVIGEALQLLGGKDAPQQRQGQPQRTQEQRQAPRPQNQSVRQQPPSQQDIDEEDQIPF